MAKTPSNILPMKNVFGPSLSKREIDFDKIKASARQYIKTSTLEEAEIMAGAVKSLEQWERCGGRQWDGFHQLLDSVLLVLGIETEPSVQLPIPPQRQAVDWASCESDDMPH